MNIALISHEDYLKHETGPGHPERPQRLRAVHEALQAAGLMGKLTQIEPVPATRQDLELVHDPQYIAHVHGAHGRGVRALDAGDTQLSAQSDAVARLAAGGVIRACDAVMDDHVRRAFCAVRPPGHHAERGRAMGFCLFNSIAIGAEHLIRRWGAGRVAVVDFDVHHGNGTQHAFEDRPDVLYASVHEHPDVQFPGTGYASEGGVGEGEGSTLNVPLMPGADDAKYREVFEQRILPKVGDFDPEVLMISAGFDAAAEDPLGHMKVSAEGFVWMTRKLTEVAEECCEGRVISVLEGGYDLAALGRDAAGHVGAMGEDK